MARLPVDPRLAAMLMAAGPLGSLNELLIIVAGLAVQMFGNGQRKKPGRLMRPMKNLLMSNRIS